MILASECDTTLYQIASPYSLEQIASVNCIPFTVLPSGEPVVPIFNGYASTQAIFCPALLCLNEIT